MTESTDLLEVLRRTAATLADCNQPWALVGGLAVSVRSEPRFTRDVDLAVAVADDTAAETLVARFQAAGFRLHLTLEHQALERLAAVRLSPPAQPAGGIVVDLLFASSGIESEICRDAEWLEIAAGLTVPVSQAGHLVATKLLAIAPDRPQDGIDLHALVANLTVADCERARVAVARIEALGANRSKRLGEDLERWLQARNR